MITIKKLYFDPNPRGVKPILFEKGLNFVIGERSKNLENLRESKKMNGVGKSVLIEMINFCLLKELSKSRLDKIPDPVLPPNINLCLEIDIETPTKIRTITIKRKKNESSPIVFLENEKEQDFEKLDTAKDYLESLVFENEVVRDRPSLRSLISLLIRDERTSYDNILYPYPESSKSHFGDLIKPHLYFFDLDLSLVERVRKIDKQLDDIKNVVRELGKDIKKEGVSPKDIEVYLNELKDKVQKLELSINRLEPGEAIKQASDKLAKLETQIRVLVSEKVAREYSARQIKSLPRFEKINSNEVSSIYNSFKDGLGDLVKKSLDQVQSFQSQIEDFHNKLMTEKLAILNSEINELESKIDALDIEASKIYAQHNSTKKIEGLKTAILLHKEKNGELEKLSYTYELLKSKQEQGKKLNRDRSRAIEKLDAEIFKLNTTINSFKEDLDAIHEYVAGNKGCHFDIKINETGKEFVNFDYRIKLDGSSGINRIKTFIYDALLMLNRVTSQRHLGFLIHDNIFASVGKDDMVRALNYLDKTSIKNKHFQYIVAINKDEFESCIPEFKFDYEKRTRIILTRGTPLLGQVYSEV